MEDSAQSSPPPPQPPPEQQPDHAPPLDQEANPPDHAPSLDQQPDHAPPLDQEANPPDHASPPDHTPDHTPDHAPSLDQQPDPRIKYLPLHLSPPPIPVVAENIFSLHQQELSADNLPTVIENQNENNEVSLTILSSNDDSEILEVTVPECRLTTRKGTLGLVIKDRKKNTLPLIVQKIKEDSSVRGFVNAGDCILAVNGNGVSKSSDVKSLLKQSKSNKLKISRKKQNYGELDEDTYTLLLANQLKSQASLCAFIIWAIQTIIYILVLLDRVDVRNRNPFNVPYGNPFQVKVAQLCAIIVTGVFEDDFLQSIRSFRNKVGDHIILGNGDLIFVERWKWILSNFGKFFQGSLAVFVNFVLIVSTDDVIDLFYNFAGMGFVGSLDNITFKLAKHNFLSKEINDEARKLEGSKIAINKPDRKSTCSKHTPSLLILFINWIFLIIGWAIVLHQQATGTFLCNRIRVQFGDEIWSSLGGFSGIYVRKRSLINDRVQYVSEHAERIDQNAMFAYCKKDKAWTFTYGESRDPCNWYAKSPESTSYDIVASDDSWYVYDEPSMTTTQFSYFSLSCLDCDMNGGNVQKDVCSGSGTCGRSMKCQCRNGRYGLNCEFPPPCKVLETIDNSVVTEWDQLYDGLTNEFVEVYGRPVYVSGGLAEKDRRVLMFIGRRWIDLRRSEFGEFEDMEDVSNQELSDYLSQKFHAVFSNYTVLYISEPMDVGTPQDLTEPENLKWFYGHHIETGGIFVQPSSEQNFYHQCKFCNEATHPCLNGSTCSKDFDGALVCDCDDAFYYSCGTRCETDRVEYSDVGFVCPLLDLNDEPLKNPDTGELMYTPIGKDYQLSMSY